MQFNLSGLFQGVWNVNSLKSNYVSKFTECSTNTIYSKEITNILAGRNLLEIIVIQRLIVHFAFHIFKVVVIFVTNTNCVEFYGVGSRMIQGHFCKYSKFRINSDLHLSVSLVNAMKPYRTCLVQRFPNQSFRTGPVGHHRKGWNCKTRKSLPYSRGNSTRLIRITEKDSRL